jgi:hypothetical protein
MGGAPTEPLSAASTTPSRRLPRGFRRTIISLLTAAGLAALGFVWYQGSHVDGRIHSTVDLKNGPIAQIIPWEGGRTAVQISRFSTLPADDLWRVATDQGRFDEFMPYVRETTVRPGPDDTLIESQILDLPHASYDLELTIRLREENSVRTAAWAQSKGLLTYNQGAWVVERVPEGAILRYQVSAALTGVPQWIVNYAMRRRLGRLLEAVESRVRDLQKREPDYFRSSPEEDRSDASE